MRTKTQATLVSLGFSVALALFATLGASPAQAMYGEASGAEWVDLGTSCADGIMLQELQIDGVPVKSGSRPLSKAETRNLCPAKAKASVKETQVKSACKVKHHKHASKKAHAKHKVLTLSR